MCDFNRQRPDVCDMCKQNAPSNTRQVVCSGGPFFGCDPCIDLVIANGKNHVCDLISGEFISIPTRAWNAPDLVDWKTRKVLNEDK